MRVLFDQGTPAPLRQLLPQHEVATAYECGWSTLSNGELLAAAESSGYDWLLTTDAALSPLNDLNLVHRDIPPALIAAQKGPFALPADQSCANLTVQVAAIDAVLGADLDIPPTDANPGLIPRGQEAATKSTVGALRGTAEGLIPYRGWVRKLSGAERYSREVAAAISAGIVRRAFLKGLGQAAGCQAPAAPHR